jgi:hypothetical protein
MLRAKAGEKLNTSGEQDQNVVKSIQLEEFLMSCSLIKMVKLFSKVTQLIEKI